MLVPHRPGQHGLPEKEQVIRQDHRLTAEVPIVFVEVDLGDASDFYQEPLLEVTQEEGRIILKVDHGFVRFDYDGWQHELVRNRVTPDV